MILKGRKIVKPVYWGIARMYVSSSDWHGCMETTIRKVVVGIILVLDVALV